MKILYLLSQRPELTGSGVYVTALMDRARRKGLDVALLAGLPDEPVLPPVLASLPASRRGMVRFGRDLPFPVVGMSDVMPYPSCCWKDLSCTRLDAYEAAFGRELRRLADEFRPDVIHANHLWVLTALARRLFPDLPVIASCHGSDLRQMRRVEATARRVRDACAGLDAALALSRAQASEIRELFELPAARVPVIGAGYDTTLFRREKNTPRRPGPCRILYAGKLSAAKGVPWLLQACRLLLDEGTEFRIDLCGAGAEQERCRRAAEPLGDRATWRGNVPQAELAELMREADVFVLPSFFEGVPLVLLEALACGCRITTTALPGVEEVFGAAPKDLVRRVPLPRLVDVDTPVTEDEEPFSRALAGALQAQCRAALRPPNPESERRRDELLAAYGWDAVFERIESVYRAVVGCRIQG